MDMVTELIFHQKLTNKYIYMKNNISNIPIGPSKKTEEELRAEFDSAMMSLRKTFDEASSLKNKRWDLEEEEREDKAEEEARKRLGLDIDK